MMVNDSNDDAPITKIYLGYQADRFELLLWVIIDSLAVIYGSSMVFKPGENYKPKRPNYKGNYKILAYVVPTYILY